MSDAKSYRVIVEIVDAYDTARLLLMKKVTVEGDDPELSDKDRALEALALVLKGEQDA